MSELNGAQFEPERPKPTPRVLNELVIGGPMHGRVAMIPEDRLSYLLFAPTDKGPLHPEYQPPVAEMYFRSDLTGDVGPGGETLRRSIFRHAGVSHEEAFAALTDMLLHRPLPVLREGAQSRPDVRPAPEPLHDNASAPVHLGGHAMIRRYPATLTYLGAVAGLAVLVACGGPAPAPRKPDPRACHDMMLGTITQAINDGRFDQGAPEWTPPVIDECTGIPEAELDKIRTRVLGETVPLILARTLGDG